MLSLGPLLGICTLSTEHAARRQLNMRRRAAS